MNYSPKPTATDIRPLKHSGILDAKSQTITFYPDDNGKLTYEDVKRMGGFKDNSNSSSVWVETQGGVNNVWADTGDTTIQYIKLG